MSTRGKEGVRKVDGPPINQFIRDERLQVIGQEGENLGEMSKRDALKLAQEAGLDLVKVGDRDTVGIAKIMDFGKFLYEKKKQQTKAKKTQKVIQIKEIKMQPKIDVGDYNTKMGNAIKFLKEGKRVKFTLVFRGRQPVSIKEVGANFFDRIKKDIEVAELGVLMEEKESKGRGFWSRIFYIKDK